MITAETAPYVPVGIKQFLARQAAHDDHQQAQRAAYTPPDYRKRRRAQRRRPSLAKMIAAAEKAGKTVSSITMPDGTVLHFGASDPDERNEWDTVLRHGTH